MAQTANKYSAQLKAKLVEMVRAGHSPSELAKYHAPSTQTIQRWYQQAIRDEQPGEPQSEQINPSQSTATQAAAQVVVAEGGQQDSATAEQAPFEPAWASAEQTGGETEQESGHKAADHKVADHQAQRGPVSESLRRGRKWLRQGDEIRRRRGAEAALPAYTEAIELLEMATRELYDNETRREWGVALERLGDAVFATEGPGTALTYYEQWHEVAETLAVEHGGVQARQDWSSALQRLARAIEISDSPERALPYYRQAATLCEKLADELQEDKTARLNWAQALDRLAISVEHVAGAESALPHFRKALNLREDLCGSATGLPAQIPQNLAQQLAQEAAAYFAQMHQGVFEYSRDGYPPNPAPAYRQSVRGDGQSGQQHRHVGTSGAAPVSPQGGYSADNARNGSGSAAGGDHQVVAFDAAEDSGQPLVDRGLEHARRGDQLYEHSGPGGAIPAYRRAIELLEQAARATEEADTCREWGVTLERLGDAILEEEGPSEALPYYQHWCEIAETLADEQNNVRAFRDYSVALSRVGYALHSSSAPQAAMSYYQKALELREEIAAEQGSFDAKKDWALALERLGSVIEETDGAEAALPRYMQALDLRREVAESQAHNVAARRAYGLANERVGMAVLTVHGPEESLPYFQTLSDVFTRLEEDLGTSEAAEEREKADTMLGKVQMAVM